MSYLFCFCFSQVIELTHPDESVEDFMRKKKKERKKRLFASHRLSASFSDFGLLDKISSDSAFKPSFLEKRFRKLRSFSESNGNLRKKSNDNSGVCISKVLYLM